MKKLIMAALVVCAAVCAEAATVKWKSDAVKTPDTSANITAARVSTYLYVMSAACAGDIWETYTTKTGSGKSAEWTMKTGSASSTPTYGSGVVTIADPASYSVSDTAYGAVIIVRDANGNGKIDVGDYYLVGQGSQNIEADTTYSTKIADLKTANWVQLTAGEPEPTPEPTSGLLLLLGVAGLALRRRRA